MAHTHSVIDDDLRFIIDPSTREIGNGSQKVKLMQYDHNSEQFTFEIPRFVEGHDMSLCNSIRVNYININKSNREQHPGVYEVSDIKVEEDNIIFSWLISRNATQYVGPLNFLIKFMCFDENDYITYEWHTDIFKSASVSTGMNNEESIEEVYPDILEKWKNDVLAEEASRITAESERVAAESERVAAESERVAAESERVTAESERVTAESERVSAESERVTAESERVAAESERVNTFAGYKTEINKFKNEIVTGKDSATDNTKFAIGEAEPNLEVPTMEEFNQLADDMTGKLSEPASGLAVGKYFRVAALDENGHAVLEAVDLPIASGTQFGVVKAKPVGAEKGIYISSEGFLATQFASASQINERTNFNNSITPYNLDYAVKAAMCDGKGAVWTADEQAAARERMGIPGDYELSEEIICDGETLGFSREIEPNGTPYNFKSIYIELEIQPSNTYANLIFFRAYDSHKEPIMYEGIKIASKKYTSYAFGGCFSYGGFYHGWIPNGNTAPSKDGGSLSYRINKPELVISGIKKVYINNNIEPLIAGDKIRIYGVRA